MVVEVCRRKEQLVLKGYHGKVFMAKKKKSYHGKVW